MEEAGVEPKDAEATEIYGRALQEAAGARFDAEGQWGGVGTVNRGWWSGRYQVVVPSSIRADRFGDVIDALRDSDLQDLADPPRTADGRKFTAADLKGATAIATAGGYMFALGDPASGDPQLIPAGGKPFVLDLESLLDQLGPRVPGAIRGR